MILSFLLYAGVIRFLLFAPFLAARLPSQALLCLLSCCVYGALVPLHRKHFWPTLVFLQAESCLFGLVMTYLTGWDSGFYLYLIAMLVYIFFLGGPACTGTVFLQLTGLITLLLLLLLTPFFPDHLNGLDAALDHLYFPLFSANVLSNGGGVILFAALSARRSRRQTSELQNCNRKLQYLATHDALTGLQNRRSMNELLQLCRAQAERSNVPFSVAMGDIDDFKAFNDTYGHSYGDQILTTLAETIRSVAREGDFVCRWGGEEILILFSATHASGARSVLLRVKDRLNHLTDGADSLSTPVTMTFGLSEYRRGQTIDELLASADEKLYRGKANGKNCIVE